MKTQFRKLACSGIVAAITLIAGCSKDTPLNSATYPSGPKSEGYTSISDFFAKNGVPAQTYTVNGSTGGTFTSPQGTVVTIPAYAFRNSSSLIVAGTVTITFKDIYKKGDMLLSNMATTTTTGKPLKSGGEFFIKADSGGNALTLAQTITVQQPLDSAMLDSSMTSYVADTNGWALANLNASVSGTVNGYIYSLYTFSTPSSSGTWCNSDDPFFFSSYTQGTLVVHETDNPGDFNTQVYLVFKGIQTTDACHTWNGNDFDYTNCVPVGLQCTIVAIGVKAGVVYSSFTPVTITANQTINFSMTATTTANFKAALMAIN